MSVQALAWEQHKAGRNLRLAPSDDAPWRAFVGIVLQDASRWKWPLRVDARMVAQMFAFAMLAVYVVNDSPDIMRILRNAHRKTVKHGPRA